MNKTAVIPIIILTLAFCLIPCAADTAGRDSRRDLFDEANKLYETNHFSAAAEKYENLIKDYGGNSSVYYNLGNAYFKSSKPGLSILNYERALKTNPRDPDTRYNLQYLRETVKEPPLTFAESALSWINSLLTLNELTIACSLFFVSLIAVFCVFIFLKSKRLLAVNAVIFAVFSFSLIWLMLKIKHEVNTTWAVSIQGNSEVRNGPGEDNSVGFTLPEGRKVVLIGISGEWAAVGLKKEGLKGWIKRKFIEII